MQAKSGLTKNDRLVLIRNLLFELGLISSDFQGKISISDEWTIIEKTTINFSSKVDLDKIIQISNQLNGKGLKCTVMKRVFLSPNRIYIFVDLKAKELKKWLVKKTENNLNLIPRIIRYERPSQCQIEYWHRNKIFVSFTVWDVHGHESIFDGKIKRYERRGYSVLLWIKKRPFGIYLESIVSYIFLPKIDSIFMDVDDISPEKMGLMIGTDIFWANKKKLSKSLYFRTLFENDINESNKKMVDLSHQFSVQELKILLLVVNVGDCNILSLEQAKIFLETANKISEFKMIKEARIRIDECLSFINKKFISALYKKNYSQCTDMLLSGANINRKFGLLEDTPLTYAIESRSDTKLAEFLLKNGADIEVFQRNETPLMKAAFWAKVKKTSLLLKFGANPNARNKSNLTAMYFLFFGLEEETRLERARQVADLLIDAGFSGKPSEVTACLKERKCNKFTLNSFVKIWLNKHQFAEKAYIQGATAGVLGERLPPELSTYIGSFFGRKDGMNLALVCKAAASLAEEEREIALRRRAEKINDSQPAINSLTVIELMKVSP